jgi:heme oxygenase
MVNGRCVEKSKHNRVVENLWFLIDELVDSTQYCSTERSIAGMTFRHAISPKNALEVLERNSCCDAESLTLRCQRFPEEAD